MAILTVGSTNPKFSYVVCKNPLAIQESKTPFERQIRKGRVYGWFPKPDNSEFRLLFLDSELEASFSETGNFEYLDMTRYSSPYLPVQILNETLRNAVKGMPEDELGFQAWVETTIEIPNRISSRMNGEGPCKTTFEEVSGNHKKIRIEGATVGQVLNTLSVVCILATLTIDSIYVPMGQDVVFKFLKSLQQARADYNLRHLFISRAITNSALFNKAKEEGLIDEGKMKFAYGNTQLQRLGAIKTAFSAARPEHVSTLIDIGCGELSHSFKLLEMYEGIIGYEADEEICRVNDLKLKKRQIESITVINAQVTAEYVEENLGVFDGADVLMSEVLEHIDPEIAFLLLQSVLNTNAERVVVTVPNEDFNKFYGMKESEMRHHEHLWEPNHAQWSAFISAALPGSRVLRSVDVGDVIEGVPCTFMAVFDKVRV